MGCGCSSGGDNEKGLSASEIKDEASRIVQKHTDKFIEDFEADLEPKLIDMGAKDITDEDSLDLEECKKLRQELFRDKFEPRTESLKDNIMADINADLMPEIEEGLPENEMVRKIALKAAVTVVDTTVTQALKACCSDLQDPPFLDRRLRGKLVAIAEGEFGSLAQVFRERCEAAARESGASALDDLAAEDRRQLLRKCAAECPREPQEERIEARVQEEVMPDVERKMARRGLEKGSFKARGALMVVKGAVSATTEQTLKGYLKGLAKKDEADQKLKGARAKGQESAGRAG